MLQYIVISASELQCMTKQNVLSHTFIWHPEEKYSFQSIIDSPTKI